MNPDDRNNPLRHANGTPAHAGFGRVAPGHTGPGDGSAHGVGGGGGASEDDCFALVERHFASPAERERLEALVARDALLARRVAELRADRDALRGLGAHAPAGLMARVESLIDGRGLFAAGSGGAPSSAAVLGTLSEPELPAGMPRYRVLPVEPREGVLAVLVRWGRSPAAGLAAIVLLTLGVGALWLVAPGGPNSPAPLRSDLANASRGTGTSPDGTHSAALPDADPDDAAITAFEHGVALAARDEVLSESALTSPGEASRDPAAADAAITPDADARGAQPALAGDAAVPDSPAADRPLALEDAIAAAREGRLYIEIVAARMDRVERRLEGLSRLGPGSGSPARVAASPQPEAARAVALARVHAAQAALAAATTPPSNAPTVAPPTVVVAGSGTQAPAPGNPARGQATPQVAPAPQLAPLTPTDAELVAPRVFEVTLAPSPRMLSAFLRALTTGPDQTAVARVSEFPIVSPERAAALRPPPGPRSAVERVIVPVLVVRR